MRNVILSPEERNQVTITRKLREIILAYQLDSKLSKDQILEMYLNEIYYGNNSYGVEAASEDYFDKHARDLSLGEAALIAGLVQSPSEYDPTRRDVPRTADGIPIATKERQAYVLEQMTRQGFITEQQAKDAYNEQLVIKERAGRPQGAALGHVHPRPGRGQVRRQDALPGRPQDLHHARSATTTTACSRCCRTRARASSTTAANNAALIAVNPDTGEILAFNGSMDYNDESIDGQVDVLRSERQPGSSIKPIVYAASFLKGWSPGTPIDDNPTCWKDTPTHQWCPTNFDGIFHGPTTVRSALGNSLNIPAVKTLDFVGVDNVVSTGAADGRDHLGAGLRQADRPEPDPRRRRDHAARHGPGVLHLRQQRAPHPAGRDHAHRRRRRQRPRGLQGAAGRTGARSARGVHDHQHAVGSGREALHVRPEYAADPRRIRPAASKTGTTDNYRDTWTDGYTPEPGDRGLGRATRTGTRCTRC